MNLFSVVLDIVNPLLEAGGELIAMSLPSDRCTRPPRGWRCERHKGHDGPCAATRVFGTPRATDPDYIH